MCTCVSVFLFRYSIFLQNGNVCMCVLWVEIMNAQDIDIMDNEFLYRFAVRDKKMSFFIICHLLKFINSEEINLVFRKQLKDWLSVNNVNARTLALFDNIRLSKL